MGTWSTAFETSGSDSRQLTQFMQGRNLLRSRNFRYMPDRFYGVGSLGEIAELVNAKAKPDSAGSNPVFSAFVLHKDHLPVSTGWAF